MIHAENLQWIVNYLKRQRPNSPLIALYEFAIEKGIDWIDVDDETHQWLVKYKGVIYREETIEKLINSINS